MFKPCHNVAMEIENEMRSYGTIPVMESPKRKTHLHIVENNKPAVPTQSTNTFQNIPPEEIYKREHASIPDQYIHVFSRKGNGRQIPSDKEGNEEFAKKAFMKFLLVYLRMYKTGWVAPDEKYAHLLRVEGLNEDVYTFQYNGANQDFKADIVPNREENSADVRINTTVESLLGISYEGLFHSWVKIREIV